MGVRPSSGNIDVVGDVTNPHNGCHKTRLLPSPVVPLLARLNGDQESAQAQ